MRSTYKVVVAAILVIILLANPTLLAWGNPPPGRWEKVAETKPGAKIIVFIKDGTKQSCRYAVLSHDWDDYGKLCVIGGGAGLGALGGLIAGASLGAPGETVYISKELAMKEAKQ